MKLSRTEFALTGSISTPTPHLHCAHMHTLHFCLPHTLPFLGFGRAAAAAAGVRVRGRGRGRGGGRLVCHVLCVLRRGLWTVDCGLWTSTCRIYTHLYIYHRLLFAVYTHCPDRQWICPCLSVCLSVCLSAAIYHPPSTKIRTYSESIHFSPEYVTEYAYLLATPSEFRM